MASKGNPPFPFDPANPGSFDPLNPGVLGPLSPLPSPVPDGPEIRPGDPTDRPYIPAPDTEGGPDEGGEERDWPVPPIVEPPDIEIDSNDTGSANLASADDGNAAVDDSGGSGGDSGEGGAPAGGEDGGGGDGEGGGGSEGGGDS